MTDRERMIKGAAPDASGEDPREKRLQAMFAADDPTAEPSEALQRRVADIAAQHQPRVARRGAASRPVGRRWTPWRIGVGLAAATALAFIGVGLAPMGV